MKGKWGVDMTKMHSIFKERKHRKEIVRKPAKIIESHQRMKEVGLDSQLCSQITLYSSLGIPELI